jgi:hypothetical protein
MKAHDSTDGDPATIALGELQAADRAGLGARWARAVL